MAQFYEVDKNDNRKPVELTTHTSSLEAFRHFKKTFSNSSIMSAMDSISNIFRTPKPLLPYNSIVESIKSMNISNSIFASNLSVLKSQINVSIPNYAQTLQYTSRIIKDIMPQHITWRDSFNALAFTITQQKKMLMQNMNKHFAFSSKKVSSIFERSLEGVNKEIVGKLDTIENKNSLNDHDLKEAEVITNHIIELSYSKRTPKRTTKIFFINLIKKLWKFLGLPQIAILVAIAIAVYTTQCSTPKHIIIQESIQEIVVIEREKPAIILRSIMKNGTRIFKRANTKSEVLFIADIGDIVEVLEAKNEWFKVRVFETYFEGWVQKKYTRQSRAR